MSLLRLCAFPRCLSGRALLDTSVFRVSHARRRPVCHTVREAAERARAGNPWTFQRQNFSARARAVFPRAADGRKRTREQSVLLDVLEARIQQLQCDFLLEPPPSQAPPLRPPQQGRGGAPARLPVGGQPRGAGGPLGKEQASRWMEKLNKEKRVTNTKLQRIQQKNTKTLTSKTPTLTSKTPTLTSKPTTKTTSKPTSKTTSKPTSMTTSKTTSKPTTKSTKNPASKARMMAEAGREAGAEAIVRTGPEADTKVKTKVKTKARAGGGAGGGGGQRKAEVSREAGQQEEAGQHEEASWDRELEGLQELQARINQLAEAGAGAGAGAGTGGEQGHSPTAVRSYLEACVAALDVNVAHRFLLEQHRRLKRRNMLTTAEYNTMMRAWAKRGNLGNVRRIFTLLDEAGLKPDLGSYAAALEAMGRITSCPAHIILRCLSQLEGDGLSLDGMFRKVMFKQDEKDMVLKAVHAVQPNYQPSSSFTQPLCSSPLVKDFYTQRGEASYPKLPFSHAELQRKFRQQLSEEQACTVTIQSVESSKPVTPHASRMRELLCELRSQWQSSLLLAFRETRQALASSSHHHLKTSLYPYLCLLQDQDYTGIMMQSLRGMSPQGDSLHSLARSLGTQVHSKLCVQDRNHSRMVHKLGQVYQEYTHLLAQDTESSSSLPREHWCRVEAAQASGPSLQGDDAPWPPMLVLELGTFLVELMVKHLQVRSNILNPQQTDSKMVPILYHMYTFRSVKQVGFIKPHPILSQIQLDAMETTLTFDSYVMPMLCPPLPWTSTRSGGYLLTPAKIMRTGGAAQHEVLLDRTPTQSMHAVLDSLNQLGNCAWRVNQHLLDVIISLFNDRGNEKLAVPPPVSEGPEVPRFSPRDPAVSPAQKATLKTQANKAKKRLSEMHSLRVSALYKLSIAHHLREQVFWFPHNMDFRGRTYPIPPHLNHLGSDVTRAILVFAEGRPLGPRGLDWVKIHLVNLTGLKKRCSLQERLDHANSLMEDILDSADHPLTGRGWWMEAEEPWQALGCCMEIANATRSPDPAQYISHLPVHQDGSCNGLQHYAALGRDVVGATSVNLAPCPLPQDVYSSVAQQVEVFRCRDAARGVQVAQVLEGVVGRRVVKQTVMTVVYGVTRYGGRLQIEKRLREAEHFPQEYLWEASHYLVHQVFNSLKEMFTGTREIQDWLTDSARLISKSGRPVEWVTPLGLPIIQPYHRPRHTQLNSTMQTLCLSINYDAKQRPDTMKQKNAFPPNFIHSLDSTHMMLTALHCCRAGVTFASVHDCFWTHAITVDTMNKVCREQFVALHSQPILQELSNFLLKKYCSGLPSDLKKPDYRRMMLLLAKVPQTGDFDLQKVKESTFFFS
ncbi:DNA-directed RNA polymerase, mitochondrial isoform X2 [Osmerus eperlanus]|uniref:DNA-directed RNA polymerase, mitochondrial isoform X2 n=1 Tax=Osmerus eperlanus TaxID=29151 RepID=UPI002E14E44C